MVDMRTVFANTKITRNDTLIGIAFGIFFVIMYKIFPQYAIGIPSLPVSIVDKYIVVTALAPLEEIAFRGLILGMLSAFTFLSFPLVAILTSLSFAMTHYLVYFHGDFLSNYSPFIGAFIFSLVTIMLAKMRGWNLWSCIVLHIIVNTYLVSLVLAVIVS